MNKFHQRAGVPWISARFFLLLLLLTACTTRHQHADEIAAAAQLRPGQVTTAAFDLTTYTRLTPGSPTLTVYLEGDGLAWITPTRLSDDPTPRQPVALQLAARDPAPSVAYIARPCQYRRETTRRGCHSAYWSSARFSPKVVEATADAIRQLLARSGATHLHLFGYSGGGTLALLLAAQGLRPDRLVTVAAVVDTTAWTTFHQLSPLTESLNPADNLRKIDHIPQIHWVGEKDEIVPPALTRTALGRMGETLPPTVQVIEVPHYTHNCCWESEWPTRLHRLKQEAAPP